MNPPLAEGSVRVVFVASHAQVGGAELQMELLLEHLGREWVAAVVCLEDGPLVERLRSGGWPVEVVATPARAGMVPAAARLRRLLRRHRPQAVHANGVKAALVSGLATVASRLPVVWLRVDLSLEGRLARVVALGCRKVVGVSMSVVEVFGRLEAGKTAVVPCGVPEPRVDRDAARRRLAQLLDAPPEAPTVVAVGRVDPGKGQRELVEIAPDLLERHPDARIALLGEVDPHHEGYAAKLRARVEELSLGDVVRFLGRRDDAPSIIAGADVLAVPSMPGPRGWQEGFGLVGVEAFWVGTPVVAYRSGALPEILGDCALLAEVGDRGALRDGILEVLEQPPVGERLAACGARRARERYSVERMVEGMQACYREVAGVRGA